MITQRRKLNGIHILYDDSGRPLTDLVELKHRIVHYYKELLGKAVARVPLDHGVVDSGPKLTDKCRDALLLPIQAKEVKDALWAIGNKKAPSLDGFTAAFYKASWSIVGRDITRAVAEFFDTGKLLKQVNATALILIPKGDSPRTIKEYRPLACCNVLLKIITKILANCLSATLSTVVSTNQGKSKRDA